MGEMVPSWNRCRVLLRRCAVSFLPSVSLHGPGMVGGEGLRRRLVSALAPAMSVFCRCSRRCQVRCGVPWMAFDVGGGGAVRACLDSTRLGHQFIRSLGPSEASFFLSCEHTHRFAHRPPPVHGVAGRVIAVVVVVVVAVLDSCCVVVAKVKGTAGLADIPSHSGGPPLLGTSVEISSAVFRCRVLGFARRLLARPRRWPTTVRTVEGSRWYSAVSGQMVSRSVSVPFARRHSSGQW